MQVQATQINNRPMGTTPVIVICTEDDITRLITSSKLLALPSGSTFIPYIDTSLTILSLFQKLRQTNTSAQQLLSGSVQIGTELSESSDLTVLSQLQLHRTGHLQIIKSVITYSYTSFINQEYFKTEDTVQTNWCQWELMGESGCLCTDYAWSSKRSVLLCERIDSKSCERKVAKRVSTTLV